METRVTRRQFVATASTAVASLTLAHCVGSAQSRPGHDGRLTARPRSGVKTSLKSGPLGLGDGGRDGVIQMPSVIPEGSIPLLIFLHGATQTGARMLTRVGEAAEQLGIAVVAPDSRRNSWDAIRGEFDDDVVFLNHMLDHVFERLNVDPARLAIGGFSDGASYGLSLGLINGDLFPRVVACSPGFIIQAPAQANRDCSSRMARWIKSCQSISVAASWCRGCCRWGTTSRSASSRDAMSFRRRSQWKRCAG